jgi:membrane associated rhomboid family serine protease
MHQASVGFHCPECTRQSGQKVVRANQLVTKPFITHVVIAFNLAVYVFGIGNGLETKGSIVEDGGLIGSAIGTTGHLIGVANGEWWRIFSSGFLHANAIHIGFNMFVLYQLGQLMEPVLGRGRYLLVYMVALVAGSFGVLLVDPNQLTVGASGAVFGLMGAAVAAMRSRGINPFQTGLGATIVLNLVITFGIPGISVGGHVGGLIGGFVAGYILTDLGPAQFRDRPQVPVAITAAVGLALVAGCLVVV